MQNILVHITESKTILEDMKTENRNIVEIRSSAESVSTEMGVASAICSLGINSNTIKKVLIYLMCNLYLVGIGAIITGGSVLAIACGTIGIIYGIGGIAIDLTTQHHDQSNTMKKLIKKFEQSIFNLSAELRQMEKRILDNNEKEYKNQKNDYNLNDKKIWIELANTFETTKNHKFPNGNKTIKVVEALIKLIEDKVEDDVTTTGATEILAHKNASLSIVVTILAIVSLARSWNTVPPTAEAVDKIIAWLVQVEAEIKHLLL